MTLLVFGHKNPDTDAICAALSYADFLQKTSRPDAVAACCGPPNKRTEYVLRRARINAPRIVMDVRPEVVDVCHRSPITALEGEAFYEVYDRVKEHHLAAVPIVSEAGKVIGILTLLDLLEIIFQGDADPIQARRVVSTTEKIRCVLQGEFQHVVDSSSTAELLIMVGAMSAEGFTKRLHRFPAEELLVVSGDRPTIQLPALEHGVRLLVVTGGYELSKGLLQLAKLNGTTVIKSPFDTATTTMRIKKSRAIGPAVQRDFLTLHAKQTVAEARRATERKEQSIFPVLNDAGEFVGIVSESDLVNPPKPQLVLVDHNELTQAVQGADEADILEVLDHHRIGGGLRSSQPIRFVNEPVGSTCTLVARHYRAAGLEPSSGMALCMASGIISDTLFLRSPTTTNVDRDCLEWLSRYCDCELDSYANDFFGIGSALRTCTPAEVVREDCKEFSEHGHRFSISQIEEIGFDLFWNRKEELRHALDELMFKRKLDFSALLVTDIISNGSLLLLSREPESWEEINYPRLDVNLYQLDDVVSRKKQLLPLISQLLDTSQSSRSTTSDDSKSRQAVQSS